MNGSDQDSDSVYATNQPDIVECARQYYHLYPTIVNNIPKETNSYSLSLENYAAIDNNLAAAQRAIGESSNLAQVCLTYTYNFPDQKYKDYVCILAVLAQVAIDSAKRRFDIDLNEEIAHIKEDMSIKQNGYPSFWTVIRKGFNKGRVNSSLECPMNYLFDVRVDEFKPKTSTLPMSHFFVKHELEENRRKSKKVEDLIEKYALELYTSYFLPSDLGTLDSETRTDTYLLLRSDFKDLIEDIKRVYISKTYTGLMSWLIDRAFKIGRGVRSKSREMQTTLNKNKALLIKVLYDVNKDAFLDCFSRNEPEPEPDQKLNKPRSMKKARKKIQ